MTLNVPGHGEMELLRKQPSDERFPESAVWVTAENWFLECLDDEPGYRAFSPGGEIYTMSQRAKMAGVWWTIHSFGGHVTYYASKVENQFGDAIEFHYDLHHGAYGDMPSSIRNWLENNVVHSHRPLLSSAYLLNNGGMEGARELMTIDYSSKGSPYPTIDKITFKEFSGYDGAGGVGSAYSEKVINYSYDATTRPVSNYCNFLSGSARSDCDQGKDFSPLNLIGVSYPDGTESSYYYSGPVVGSSFDGIGSGGAHLALTSLVNRSGMLIDYEYQKLQRGVINDAISGSDRWLPAISRRSVIDISGSLGGVGGNVWQHTDYTIRTRGNQRSETIISGGGREASYEYERRRSSSVFGRLMKETILIGGGGGSFSISYDWDIIRYNDASHGATRDNNKFIISKVAMSGGFEKIYDYDEYGFMVNVREKGVFPDEIVERDRSISYFNPYAESGGEYYILGVKDGEWLDDYEIYSATFNLQGRPIRVSHNGAEKRIEYLISDGDSPYSSFYSGSLELPTTASVSQPNTGLIGKISWNNGAEHKMFFSSYGGGVPSSVVYSDGSYVNRSVLTSGRIIRDVNHFGYSNQYEYDAAGRLVGRIGDTVSGVVRESYVNWLTPFHRETRDNGTITTERFYGTGLLGLIEIGDVDYSASHQYGKLWTESYVYDRFGSLTSHTVNGHETRYTYDGLGRKLSELDEYNGRLKTYCYYMDGVSASDCFGMSPSPIFVAVATRYIRHQQAPIMKWQVYDMGGYDNQGLDYFRHYYVDEDYYFPVDEVTSREVIIRRNPSLMKEFEILASGRRLRFEYDEHGRISLGVDASEGGFRYGYNPDGSKSYIVRLGFTSGRLINYEYDLFGNVEAFLVNGSRIAERSYYPGGALKNSINYRSGVEVDFSYLSNGLMRQETITFDDESYSLIYEYDQYGHMAGMTYPSGEMYPYSFTGRGLPVGVGSVGNVVDLSHWGAIQSMEYGPIKKEMEFRPDGLPASIKAEVPGHGSLLLHNGYSYDLFGNKVSVNDRVDGYSSVSLRYDAANRVRFSSHGGVQTNYTYADSDDIMTARHTFPDESVLNERYRYTEPGRLSLWTVGRQRNSVSHDSFGRVTGVSGKLIDYYPDGLTKSVTTADGVSSFRYDAEGRLVHYINEEGIERHFIHSTVLGNKVYKKNMVTGLEADFLYLGPIRIARAERIPLASADSSDNSSKAAGSHSLQAIQKTINYRNISLFEYGHEVYSEGNDGSATYCTAPVLSIPCSIK